MSLNINIDFVTGACPTLHLLLYSTYSKGYFVNNSVHTSLIETKHGRVKKKSISKSSKIEQNKDSFAVAYLTYMTFPPKTVF